MQQFYKDVGVKYGHLSFSAAYRMRVQHGTRDYLQEAFYDFIESIKVVVVWVLLHNITELMWAA